jgi:hypothetical protein
LRTCSTMVLNTITPGICVSRCGPMTSRLLRFAERRRRAISKPYGRAPAGNRAGQLTRRQAVALAGKLYRAWVSSEGKERTTAVILTPRGFVMYRSGLDGDEDEALILSVSERLQATRNSGDAADLEPILGLIVNRLLLAQGIAEVDAPSRAMLLAAFADALRCFLDPSPQCRWRLRLRSQIRTAPGGASSREQDRRPPALPTAKVSLSRTAQMPHRTTPCIGLVANTPVQPAARAPGRAKDQLGCIWLWRCNSFLPDGLSKRAAIGHRAFNGDVAERLKALVC